MGVLGFDDKLILLLFTYFAFPFIDGAFVFEDIDAGSKFSGYQFVGNVFGLLKGGGVGEDDEKAPGLRHRG